MDQNPAQPSDPTTQAVSQPSTPEVASQPTQQDATPQPSAPVQQTQPDAMQPPAPAPDMSQAQQVAPQPPQPAPQEATVQPSQDSTQVASADQQISQPAPSSVSQPAPTDPTPREPQQPSSQPAPAPETPSSVSSSANTANTNPPASTTNLQSSMPTATLPSHDTHQSDPFGKIFPILLVLILLAGIGYAGYVMGVNRFLKPASKSITNSVQEKIPATPTPTPDPTASWQVYSNAKYAYSIKYPAGLVSNEVNTYYHYVEFKNATNSATLPAFLVAVIPNTFSVANIAAYNYMSTSWINSLYALKSGESATSSGTTFLRLPDVQVEGQNALAVSVTAKGIKQERVYVKNASNTYMLSNNYQDPTELNTYNLFISSFKFTQ